MAMPSPAGLCDAVEAKERTLADELAVGLDGEAAVVAATFAGFGIEFGEQAFQRLWHGCIAAAGQLDLDIIVVLAQQFHVAAA